ncbi:MAG: N-6 DNA methylase [Clostridiales bacterium]|nr:N-6 DNA methylase [Clostridiales bacterium]
MKNVFCDFKDLKNEASVEANFVLPLITALGYGAGDVSFKASISEIAVGTGRKKVLYKPDFVLKIKGIPAIVVDAKSPDESLDPWELQCSSYCLELNKFFDYNPVQYYLISNGAKTNLYKWDVRKPLLCLGFDDFSGSSAKYKQLLSIISIATLKQEAEKLKTEIDESPFEFASIELDALNEKFRKIHNLIWSTEKKSPSSAFVELMKIVFVKINKDAQIHEKYNGSPTPVYSDMVFSAHWVSSQTENENPVNDPLFRNLVLSLEKEIDAGGKKRVFDKDEQINLSTATINKIVKEFEHIDFYSMEEDVHGRLFESFLDATVRGRDIGQFFTPRDIVELMVDLADIKVTKHHVDSVLDACCGSGGFLITAMRKMIAKARALAGTSSSELDVILKTIEKNALYGIDAGSDPAMHRIARMNMYLHGDGGSKIFYADSLDKQLLKIGSGSIEENKQLDEIRKIINSDKKQFDVILSNPPFSLKYTRDDPEQAEILNQYALSVDRDAGKINNKLLSSVMFIERYWDLVADSGVILAIIDDSILSGDSFSQVRDYIREKFIINAIISLPGDAFKRSSARVKTSIVILRKRHNGEMQNDVFMASTRYLGLEHKVAKRIGINPSELNELKNKEHDAVVEMYRKYQDGADGNWRVPYADIVDRLDVKFCINDRGRKKTFWQDQGYQTTKIGNELCVKRNRKTSLEDDGTEYQLLKVTYNGEVVDGDILSSETSSYQKLSKLEEWDILISNMGVGRGAVGIVPPYHANKYVSDEYTILRAASKIEAVFYVNLLRAKEMLADMLSSATGMNRGRIKWDVISDIDVPKCDPKDKDVETLVLEMESFWDAHIKFSANKKRHETVLATKYDVDGWDAHERWLGFKPPE